MLYKLCSLTTLFLQWRLCYLALLLWQKNCTCSVHNPYCCWAFSFLPWHIWNTGSSLTFNKCDWCPGWKDWQTLGILTQEWICVRILISRVCQYSLHFPGSIAIFITRCNVRMLWVWLDYHAWYMQENTSSESLWLSITPLRQSRICYRSRFLQEPENIIISYISVYTSDYSCYNEVLLI